MASALIKSMLSLKQGVPPPEAKIKARSCFKVSLSTKDSQSRKVPSPCIENISEILSWYRSSINWSRSKKGKSISFASCLPKVLFPDPGSPTNTTLSCLFIKTSQVPLRPLAYCCGGIYLPLPHLSRA